MEHWTSTGICSQPWNASESILNCTSEIRILLMTVLTHWRHGGNLMNVRLEDHGRSSRGICIRRQCLEKYLTWSLQSQGRHADTRMPDSSFVMCHSVISRPIPHKTTSCELAFQMTWLMVLVLCTEYPAGCLLLFASFRNVTLNGWSFAPTKQSVQARLVRCKEQAPCGILNGYLLPTTWYWGTYEPGQVSPYRGQWLESLTRRHQMPHHRWSHLMRGNPSMICALFVYSKFLKSVCFCHSLLHFMMLILSIFFDGDSWLPGVIMIGHIDCLRWTGCASSYLMLGTSAGVHPSILETENALWIANYVSIRSTSK